MAMPCVTVKKVEHLEVRWTETISKEPERYLEIVQRIDRELPEISYCITLCYWKKDSEGWNLQFVGGRPFDYDNYELFLALSRYGQRILDAEYEFEQKIS